jgi:glycerol kinase
MAYGSMAHEAVLALDVGTSSAKALLVSLTDGTVLSRGSAPVTLVLGAPGHVEQDPHELRQATLAAGAEALAGRSDVRVAGLAITNQRESVVMWDRRTGEPLGPVISWQDSRAADSLVGWTQDERDRVQATTGLTLDAMYSAPKMRWLLDAREARTRDVVVGTIDSWIVRCLTGETVIEAGNASRTLLVSLATGDWDDDLLDAFAIPRSVLPDVRASDSGFGVTMPGLAIPAGLPVVAVLADSHAALFAYGAAGGAKATYGTGTSVMAPLSELSAASPGVDTTIAWWRSGPAYAREGNVLATGQAVDWVASLIEPGSARPGGVIVTEAASAVSDSGGVTLVPAFTGLGAPHWDRSATAILSGMTSQTTLAHVARAAIECVAHQVADLVDAFEADGQASVDVLHVDGGVSSSDLLVATQADLLGRPVVRSREAGLSALGVARLAAQTLGAPVPDLATDPPIAPHMDDHTRQAARERWRAEVGRARAGEVAPAGPTRVTGSD